MLDTVGWSVLLGFFSFSLFKGFVGFLDAANSISKPLLISKFSTDLKDYPSNC